MALSYPATQTAPSATAIALGWRSSDNVRSSDPVAGSISNSSSVDRISDPQPPAPYAIAPRLAPGKVIVWVTVSVAGSIRVTVAPTVLATQTAPRR